MRTSYSSACFVLAACSPAIHAVTLNQFQPIDGFTQACVNAYNTPLSGCTASDFQQGSCSTTCIAFLEALTKILKANCGGTSAYPNTLIGSFFNNEGTSQLCPNVLEGSEGSDIGATTGFVAATTYTFDADPSTSVTTPLSFTTATLPILSAAPTISTPSSASAAATTTQIAIINTTVGPNPSPPSAASSSTDRSSDRSRIKSSSSSAPTRSTATADGGDNGGGSPLDVGSSSSSIPSTRIQVWMLGLIVVSAGLFQLM